MFKYIKSLNYSIKEKYNQDNKNNKNKFNINFSFIKKSIILLSILALNIIFIFIVFSKEKIGSHLQKNPKRKLNIKSDNKDRDRNISDYPEEKYQIICKCEIIKVFRDNQDMHRKLKCKPEEKFNCTLQDFLYGYCIFIKDNCDCEVIEVTQDYLEVDCICDSTFNCSVVDFFKGNCSNKTNNEENPELIFHILDQIENGNCSDIFTSAIEEEKNFIQSKNNITYQISTVSSQYSTNLSTVELEECESILKDHYSLNESEKLVLLKLEHYKIEDSKIPIIEYQLFSKEGKKLNLSLCDKIEQSISIPVAIDEKKEFIYNPNSSFYHDKCSPYTTEYSTDFSMFDRKNDFNEKPLSLCEKDCSYKGYNIIDKRVTCKCKTKDVFPNENLTAEKLDAKEFLHQFVNFKKNFVNLYVLTCNKEHFSSDGLKKNSGSYLTIIFIVAVTVLTIIFCIRGHRSFQKKVNVIIDMKISKYRGEQNETGTDFALDFEKNNQNNQPNFYNDYEINNSEYSEALKIDKRTFLESYWSLLKTKHILLFTFFIENDYNSTEIKVCLLLFCLCLDYAINGLFFNDPTLHQIYVDRGQYNFFYQLKFSILSILFSLLITNLIACFAIFEDKIAEMTKTITSETKKKINDYIDSLKCKFVIFFTFMLLFLLLFWFYLSSFCAIFKNSQKPLIIDTIISLGISLIYPFIIVIIPCTMRYCALRAKNKDKKCLYFASDKIGDFLLLLH